MEIGHIREREKKNGERFEISEEEAESRYLEYFIKQRDLAYLCKEPFLLIGSES